MKAKKHTSINIPNILYCKLCFIAKKDIRSINGQIVYIIRRFIENYENEHGKIN